MHWARGEPERAILPRDKQITSSGGLGGEQSWTGKDSLGHGTQRLGRFRILFCSQCQRWGGIQQRQGHREHPSRSLMGLTKVLSVPSGHYTQMMQCPRPGPPGELVSYLG